MDFLHPGGGFKTIFKKIKAINDVFSNHNSFLLDESVSPNISLSAQTLIIYCCYELNVRRILLEFTKFHELSHKDYIS